MAYLSYPVNMYPDSGGYAVKRSIYKAFTTDSSATYLHFKTNVPIASYIMTVIEAVGYNYGPSQPVRCAWGFYTYGTYIVSSSVRTCYSGVEANGMYASSDGYVCIRGYAPGGSYFNGFILNGYQTAGNGRGYDLQITAASYGTNSGSAF
jgi:hypothetical protein